ncbi:MAG: hypothetical protein LT102_02510 [Burkholderiaceae bacterium]|nr:hypothetical protein [Burkholderiaceae bacterium]
MTSLALTFFILACGWKFYKEWRVTRYAALSHSGHPQYFGAAIASANVQQAEERHEVSANLFSFPSDKSVAMKRVRITLDEEVAASLRASAALANKSVSHYIAELLETRMHESRNYANAMRRFLDRRPSRINETRAQLPKRDEFHDRSDLR